MVDLGWWTTYGPAGYFNGPDNKNHASEDGSRIAYLELGHVMVHLNTRFR